jgi:hypothetical protein
MTTATEAAAVAQAPVRRQAFEDASIRPFNVHVPEAKLQDLRRRIAAGWRNDVRIEGKDAILPTSCKMERSLK